MNNIQIAKLIGSVSEALVFGTILYLAGAPMLVVLASPLMLLIGGFTLGSVLIALSGGLAENVKGQIIQTAGITILVWLAIMAIVFQGLDPYHGALVAVGYSVHFVIGIANGMVLGHLELKRKAKKDDIAKTINKHMKWEIVDREIEAVQDLVDAAADQYRTTGNYEKSKPYLEQAMLKLQALSDLNDKQLDMKIDRIRKLVNGALKIG